MDDFDPRDDGLGAMRGIIWNLPLALLLWAVILWAAFGCATALHFGRTFNLLNLHRVDADIVRSGQPRPGELDRIVEDQGIRSVINLRGARPGEGWYDQEVADSERLGLVHIDIGMSARRLPHREDLREYILALDELPRPILVHCAGGADRTGEEVAIHWMLRGKVPAKASAALSIIYGHILDRFPAKTYFVFKVWQGREWALELYNPCEQEYRYYDQTKYCGPDAFRGYEPEGDT